VKNETMGDLHIKALLVTTKVLLIGVLPKMYVLIVSQFNIKQEKVLL
jgi:hypothetical protein